MLCPHHLVFLLAQTSMDLHIVHVSVSSCHAASFWPLRCFHCIAREKDDFQAGRAALPAFQWLSPCNGVGLSKFLHLVWPQSFSKAANPSCFHFPHKLAFCLQEHSLAWLALLMHTPFFSVWLSLVHFIVFFMGVPCLLEFFVSVSLHSPFSISLVGLILVPPQKHKTVSPFFTDFHQLHWPKSLHWSLQGCVAAFFWRGFCCWTVVCIGFQGTKHDHSTPHLPCGMKSRPHLRLPSLRSSLPFVSNSVFFVPCLSDSLCFIFMVFFINGVAMVSSGSCGHFC